MSFFTDVKQLFRAPASPLGTTTPGPLGPRLPPTHPLDLPWDTACGEATRSVQERTLSFHNAEVTGRCSGQIQHLVGATLITVFEDLPRGMPSLMVRLSVQAETGRLTSTVRRIDGTLLTLATPGTVEVEIALESGQFRFKCQADSPFVQGLHYEVTII